TAPSRTRPRPSMPCAPWPARTRRPPDLPRGRMPWLPRRLNLNLNSSRFGATPDTVRPHAARSTMSVTSDPHVLRELMSSRRSVRGYLPDPVPADVIAEIIETAILAPSSMNTQPWHFYVVTGEPLDRIREETSARMIAGEPVKRDLGMVEDYRGVYRQRQIDIAVQLFTSMGIERHDKERRLDWTLRGFRQFDAPASIIVTYD